MWKLLALPQVTSNDMSIWTNYRGGGKGYSALPPTKLLWEGAVPCCPPPCSYAFDSEWTFRLSGMRTPHRIAVIFCLHEMDSINLSRDMRFPTMWYARPAKSQISLRIRAV